MRTLSRPAIRRPRLRRTTILTSAAALLLSSGGAALAYYTSGGFGSGSGEVLASVGDIDVYVSGPSSVVLEMGKPVTLSGTFGNSNTVPVGVEKVDVTITQIAPPGGPPTDPSVCSAADFVVAPAVPVAPEHAFPVTAKSGLIQGYGTWSGATIELHNDPSRNQNGCRGKQVSLKYVIANT